MMMHAQMSLLELKCDVRPYSKLADHFWAHFNAPSTCNPHGLMHSSGSCQEAVANGGSIGNGKLGETQIIVSGSKIVIDTKVKDGEVLNNSIEF